MEYGSVVPRAGWCVPACYVNGSYYIPMHVLSRLSAWKPVRGTVLLSRTGLIGRLIRKFQYCDGVKLKLFFLTTPELNGIGLGFCCARRPACSKHSPSCHSARNQAQGKFSAFSVIVVNVRKVSRFGLGCASLQTTFQRSKPCSQLVLLLDT